MAAFTDYTMLLSNDKTLKRFSIDETDTQVDEAAAEALAAALLDSNVLLVELHAEQWTMDASTVMAEALKVHTIEEVVISGDPLDPHASTVGEIWLEALANNVHPLCKLSTTLTGDSLPSCVYYHSKTLRTIEIGSTEDPQPLGCTPDLGAALLHCQQLTDLRLCTSLHDHDELLSQIQSLTNVKSLSLLVPASYPWDGLADFCGAVRNFCQVHPLQTLMLDCQRSPRPPTLPLDKLLYGLSTSQLQSLYVQGFGIEQALRRPMELSNRSLSKLTFSLCDFGPHALSVLDNLRGLQRLTMRWCWMDELHSDVDWQRLVKSNAGLQWLDFGQSAIDQAVLLAIAEAANDLERLDLEIGDDTADALAILLQGSRLRTLMLRPDSVTAEDGRMPRSALQALRRGLLANRHLHHLGVKGMGENANGLVDAVRQHPSLQVLELGQLESSVEGLASMLDESPSLSHLAIGDSRLTRDMVHDLARGVSQLSLLETLHLEECSLPHGSLPLLAEAVQDSALQKLVIRPSHTIQSKDVTGFWQRLSTLTSLQHIGLECTVMDATTARLVLQTVQRNPAVVSIGDLTLTASLAEMGLMIEFYRALNHSQIPSDLLQLSFTCLWPHVCTRLNPSTLFYFLRSKSGEFV